MHDQELTTLNTRVKMAAKINAQPPIVSCCPTNVLGMIWRMLARPALGENNDALESSGRTQKKTSFECNSRVKESDFDPAPLRKGAPVRDATSEDEDVAWLTEFSQKESEAHLSQVWHY